MLILTRTVGQRLMIGEHGETTVTVLAVKGNQVRIGVEAEKDTPIDREEIYQRKLAERAANDSSPDCSVA